MNRIILACIALALPQFAVAASCDMLPYVNQCQGSNLWPAPAGWYHVTHNPVTCQPTPGYTDLVGVSLGTYGPIASSPNAACQGYAASGPYPNAGLCPIDGGTWWGGATTRSYGAGYHCTHAASGGLPSLPTTPNEGEWTSTWKGSERCCHAIIINGAHADCDPYSAVFREAIEYSAVVGRCDTEGQLYFLTSGGALTLTPSLGDKYVCKMGNAPSKPNDGVCTARWTSSAKTAIQKDPLDPDCDAQSCVFDGTCKLL